MSKRNRIYNSKNHNQGAYKRVLCVCSAGLLRSPTVAVVLSQEPFNFNTRAAGIAKDFALIVVDEILLYWADEVVCMQKDQKETIERMLGDQGLTTPVVCLDIGDSFEYRDPKLVSLIKDKYSKDVADVA